MQAFLWSMKPWTALSYNTAPVHESTSWKSPSLFLLRTSVFSAVCLQCSGPRYLHGVIPDFPGALLKMLPKTYLLTMVTRLAPAPFPHHCLATLSALCYHGSYHTYCVPTSTRCKLHESNAFALFIPVSPKPGTLPSMWQVLSKCNECGHEYKLKNLSMDNLQGQNYHKQK